MQKLFVLEDLENIFGVVTKISKLLCPKMVKISSTFGLTNIVFNMAKKDIFAKLENLFLSCDKLFLLNLKPYKVTFLLPKKLEYYLHIYFYTHSQPITLTKLGRFITHHPLL